MAELASSRLSLWEHEPGTADLTEKQQELYQDLALLIENGSRPFHKDPETVTPTIAVPSVEPRLAAVALPVVPDELLRLKNVEKETVVLQVQLSTAVTFLTDLSKTLVKVKEKTDALYGDCEDLVQKQHQLTAAADLLHSKMEPLLEFDRLAVQLNAPGLTATSDNFLTLLDRLLINMAYLAENPTFKEVTLFKTRYGQLFSKAASLVRNEVSRNFQAALAQVSSKPLVAAGSQDDVLGKLSNFYSLFQQATASLRLLLRDLDERGMKYPEYYCDLVQDCHRMYFSTRSQLVNPFVQTAIVNFKKNARKNTSELFRTICSFLVRICREEYRLYYQYFSQPSSALTDFLSGVCQQFYDGIRPEIIHLDQVEKISDVCCFLSQEILREHGTDTAAELVPFVEFVQVLLADSRERLMFRVTAFIQQEIVSYTPSRGDLAYPDKLEILQQLIQTSKEEARNRMSSRASISSVSSRIFEERYLFSVESQGFWYPTLRRAVGFLGKLMNSLDTQSFKVVAQEVIFQTLDSLTRASVDLLKLKGQLHADLFLISHVLVLREHLTLYQMDLSTEETSLDFSRVVGAAKGMMTMKGSNGVLSLTSRNALLEFFLKSSPDVKVSTIDCRKEVDSRLRGVCLQLVDHVCAKILGPLPEFVDKAELLLSMQKPSNDIKLNNQAFATPSAVQELVAVVYRNIKNDLPVILTQFLLYLISMDTQHVLYKPVRANIWRCLERMNKIVQDGYDPDERAVLGWPSPEQWNAMLNVTPRPVVLTQISVQPPVSGVVSVQHV